jgi:sigma-E factor negative regulatory protein RseA
MTSENLSVNEQISALVDGQLRGEAATQAVQVVAQDAQARANWHAYHVVGEVLRAQALPWRSAKDKDFLSKLSSRLQQEPTPWVAEFAINSVAAYASSQSATVLDDYKKEAANDPNMRWKWLAGLASLALVAVLGWGVVGGLGGVGTPSYPAQLAQAPIPTAPTAPSVQTQAADEPNEAAPVMVRDPRLDQMLQAHQQFGGASALQMPSGFVRNATFDRPAR